MRSPKAIKILALACCLIGAAFFSTASPAKGPELCTGQTIYVASYSTVFLGGKDIEFPLASTLVVRNTDPHRDINLRSIKYYGSQGHMLKDHLSGPLTIPPLGILRFPVKEKDPKAVVDGACFLVEWESPRPVNAPVVECLMIGSAGQQGISFVSSGVVIQPAK